MQIATRHAVFIAFAAALGSAAGSTAYRYFKTSTLTFEPSGALIAGVSAAAIVFLVKTYADSR